MFAGRSKFGERDGHVRIRPLQVQVEAGFLDKAIRFWNPDKTRFWQKAGIDLVIGKREGYFLYDVSGRRLIELAKSMGVAYTEGTVGLSEDYLRKFS